jgi:tRNA nucleotidyltransferase (CCA-adding enzyme)
METKLPKAVHQLGRLFRSHGHEIRVVGGWVRDRLRGIEPKDLDLCTTALPEQMIELCQSNQIAYAETGLKHGTLTIIQDRPYEVTTLRVDVETDGRHARVAFTDDWAQDAARRDFTVNAMSMSLDGEVFDYFGGRDHLEKHRVVFVGDPERRIREDYLRILRYFRFCGRMHDLYGFVRQGYTDVIRSTADGLTQVSGERIWLEMAKILSGDLVWRQLNGMMVAGVFEHIGLGRLNYRDIARADTTRSVTDNPLTVLAALTEQPSVVAEAWRMSRPERVMLDFLQAKRALGRPPTLDELKDVATSRYGRFAAEWAALWGPSLDLDSIRAWEIPEFPVRGADLIALGVPAGPAVGTKLAELEQHWKSTGYKKSRGDLLAEVSNPI